MCSWGPLPIVLRCDGVDNCGDNTDEENCEEGKKFNFISVNILFEFFEKFTHIIQGGNQANLLN